MSAPEAHRAIDAIWHMESSRLIAALARIYEKTGAWNELLVVYERELENAAAK